ncbi:polysaccharide lyase family protein [Flavitalea sp. BT771]|uniref:polysaccharide lyase family protein n=1 Tax=Flavitalea sp. BT771 TaxID=3063329 RepID=UPI0026E3C932|nr:polysaccharide lyase family protein [Flavitalea sp. BT771]MDO6431097.1 polysaccharide lyase family protein [Flavitalea sp. BT771]MDV6220004.1 polysaccharide lyase family protein [Flavitalea sp. BT771]
MNHVACLLIAFTLSVSLCAQHKGGTYLWQIGKPDNSFNEFAGAPDQGSRFERDGVFIVGRSHEKTDWPFAHPGPDDAWAGSRQHSFSILFGVKDLSSTDSCRLQFKLADTHDRTRDQLQILINGHEFTKTLPSGAGAAIDGDVSKGKKYAFTITFPADVLRKGDNSITITNVAGSWFLYDWVGLETPAGITSQAVGAAVFISEVKGQPCIIRRDNVLYQTAQMELLNTGNPGELTVKVQGVAPQVFQLSSGSQQLELRTPVVTKDSMITIAVEKDRKVVAERTVAVQPVTLKTVYILPHSHNDIGYTEIQTAVEQKQIDNLLKGIEYSRKTKDYPEGARFVWNLEGTYAADLFLQRMNDRQKKEFIEALKDGGVALNGMYLNTLTGLCRPEELLQLFKFSTTLARQTGVKVDAAMISDVPGYTWGTVAAMAQAGIRYFSAAPNFFDRIGDILPAWENKPFYWLSPSGKEKLLVWIPYKGYALSHTLAHPTAAFVVAYAEELRKIKYPYGISYLRWSGHGDNAVPDPEISEFAKEWNQKYVWPHFIISSTSQAFSAFEKAYGPRLPIVQGDWTGYWEDGAASSALETSMNRATSSRLSQAEALWAITSSGNFPADKFNDAWHNVLLYSEHTWGADISVTTPLAQKTIEQWDIKRSYAVAADSLSRILLAAAVPPATAAAPSGALDVFNTSSWMRTNLVLVSPELSSGGDLVHDAAGKLVPSQRLSTGELAFVAADVPAFAAKRYLISRSPSSKTATPKDVQVNRGLLDNGVISVSIDPKTGALTSVRRSGMDNNFVDSATGNYANDYLFLNGSDTANLQRNGPVAITVKEKGPVLTTLSITSAAPGCNSLTREVRLVNGFDYVELINIVDKQRAELNPHPGDYAWANTGGKESLNFGFPFNVTDAAVKIDIPFAVMRPEADQIPGSCKNWLEVGQWADVSNDRLGITWVTLDAPLVQVGGVTATLLGGQTNPDVWRKKIAPTQKLYSWAMNNHWETNYRAYQEGIVTFRYALRPHRNFQPAEATRFATGLTQPLIIAKADGQDHSLPKLTLTSNDILVQVLKPSEDGKAWIVTLFNASAKPAKTSLRWSAATGAMHTSNTSEQPMDEVKDAVELAPWDVVTLRVEK